MYSQLLVKQILKIIKKHWRFPFQMNFGPAHFVPFGALWAPFGHPLGALWAPFGRPLGPFWGGGGMLAEPFKSAAQGLKP